MSRRPRLRGRGLRGRGRGADGRGRRAEGPPAGCIVAFASIFVLAGLAIVLFLGVLPALRVVRAGGWVETPCRIVHSEVDSQTDSEGGTSYRVDIRYTYTFEGVSHESDRYDFAVGYTSGIDAKNAAVRANPVGSERLCYVDPAEPSEAVMDRTFGGYLWWGAMGLPFSLMGMAFIVLALRARRRARGPRADRAGNPNATAAKVPEVTRAGGFLELRSQNPPLQKLLVLLAVALFWNGIVSVFVVQVVSTDSGIFRWGLAVFLIPFVIVGLGLLAGVGHAALALRNPRALVTLRRAEVRPGDPVEFAWEFAGRIDRIERLTIDLVGTEKATYRRGTNTRTDECRFHEDRRIERTTGDDLSFGTGSIEVPAGSMPTFESPNNGVVWSLELKAEIPRWPDVKLEFPIPVLPHPVEGRPS